MSVHPRHLTRTLLIGQVVLCLMVLAVAPHGFPADHPRFWLHTALPGAGLLACVVLTRFVGLGALATTTIWGGFAVGLLGFFREEALLPAVVALCVAGLGALLARRLEPGAHPMGVLFFTAGLLSAAALRGPPPTTHPGGPSIEGRFVSTPPIHQAGDVRIQVDPRLDVHDASRHRFQTALGPSALPLSGRIRVEESPGTTRVHGETLVPADVYAHLSTYASITLTGHEALSLAFSPCPTHRFPVEPADYPWGRPVQVATVSDDRTFRVQRARSGEKGPFTTLCQSRLPADAALEITVFDRDLPVARIGMLDYARQLSTALSPAAGYGLPQNALTFRRLGDDPSAPVWIHATLAGTGIGIGWDSVGHEAGRYPNRIEVLTLPAVTDGLHP